MPLDSNYVQPNAVVDFNGNTVTVVADANGIVTLGNHENGEVTQVYRDYLVENAAVPEIAQPDQPTDTTVSDSDTDDPGYTPNPTGYDPVTGKPNPPASSTPSPVSPVESSGPVTGTSPDAPTTPPDSSRANPTPGA